MYGRFNNYGKLPGGRAHSGDFRPKSGFVLDVQQAENSACGDNSVVIENKLASRHHALIQKIKDDYYLKDENSTNGTLLNGKRIPADKYVKLSRGDKITIGSANLVFG